MVDCTLRRNKGSSFCRGKAVGEGNFRIVLPKRDNSGQKIDNKRYGKYIDSVNERFGGSTTIPTVLGCFKGKDKKISCEENLVLSGVRDLDGSGFTPSQREKALQRDHEFMKRLSKKAGKDFGQESILVEFDRVQDVSFVPGKRKNKLSKRKIFDDFFNRNV